MNISPFIDPNTGDYTLNLGQILNENSILTQIGMSINTWQGTCPFDPTFGSNLFRFKNSFTIPRLEIQKEIISCLQWMLDQNIIQNLSVIVHTIILNKITIEIYCVDANGVPLELKLNIII